MADNADNGNYKSRLIAAPHPWPFLPKLGRDGCGEAYFYLSWAGWELYLNRRLGLKPASSTLRPLLMEDVLDPERDFLFIDQLAERVSQLGAGALDLEAGRPEGLRALIGGISAYDSGRSRDFVERRPLLDDRSYLTLWAISEFRALESDRALAEAASRQKDMWALLKGEEQPEADSADKPSIEGPHWTPSGTDRRALYAWKCWQRLAVGLLHDSDRIIPTISLSDE